MSYPISSVPIHITPNPNHTCSILFPPYKVNKTLKLEYNICICYLVHKNLNSTFYPNIFFKRLILLSPTGKYFTCYRIKAQNL